MSPDRDTRGARPYEETRAQTSAAGMLRKETRRVRSPRCVLYELLSQVTFFQKTLYEHSAKGGRTDLAFCFLLSPIIRVKSMADMRTCEGTQH